MKKLFIFVLLIINICFLFAQTKVGNKLTYTQVVRVDSSMLKPELFFNAQKWMALTYKSSKDVIQVQDQERGEIIGKGAIQYTSKVYYGNMGTKGWIRYNINIQVKDGRYKYEFTDFVHEGNPLNTGGQFSFGLITEDKDCPYDIERWASQNWRNKVWQDIQATIDSQIKSIIESLILTMESVNQSPKSEW